MCVCARVLVSDLTLRSPRAYTENGALLSAVKVCQWVTLTPMQKRDEGGAGELGHMGRNEHFYSKHKSQHSATESTC